MDYRLSIDTIEYDISNGAIANTKLPNLLNLFTEINQTCKNNKPLNFHLFGLTQYIFIDDENNSIVMRAGEIINISSLINSDSVKFTNASIKLQKGKGVATEVRADLSFEIADANITIPLFICNDEIPLKQKALKVRFAFQFYFK